jgi:glycosyl transferase family 17
MLRVWDAFLWVGDGGDEYNMLECRLRELEDAAVYRHVLVEARRTHRGPAKETLNFPEHKDRYAEWLDRIVYVVADLPEHVSWQDRIGFQRECVRTGLKDAAPDDVVILSDCDEILTPRGVEVAARGEHVRFDQRHAIFCADWVAPNRWAGPSAARLRDIGSFAGFRLSGTPTGEGAGTHLSWIGGPDEVKAKIGRYGHSETDAQMHAGLADGSFLLRGTTWEGQCTPETVDETWPRWVYERKCPPAWFRDYWAEDGCDVERGSRT